MSNNIWDQDINNRNEISNQFLTFEIDGEDCGIEIAYVSGIQQMKPITRVPHMPRFIEGLINLRGELIAVLDVRKRFGMMPKEHDENTCIITIFHEDYTLGIVVDAVRETVIIDESNIAPPPNAKLNYANQFIRNIGKRDDDRVVLLLDLERFFKYD